jgi:hypothetical protein
MRGSQGVVVLPGVEHDRAAQCGRRRLHQRAQFGHRQIDHHVLHARRLELGQQPGQACSIGQFEGLELQRDATRVELDLRFLHAQCHAAQRGARGVAGVALFHAPGRVARVVGQRHHRERDRRELGRLGLRQHRAQRKSGEGDAALHFTRTEWGTRPTATVRIALALAVSMSVMSSDRPLVT